MLEQLFNLVQENAQEDVIENPQIPNEHNGDAMALATSSIFSGLQGAAASGGIGSILNLLGGKSSVSTGNPIVSGIMQNFAGGLMSKLGITNPIAQSIAASFMPKVLNKLIGRTSNPQDSGFNINGLIGSLMGGNQQASDNNHIGGQAGGGLDFNNILNMITGGKQAQAPQQQQQADNDGFGFDDIARMIGGKAPQAEQPQSGGGIMDILNQVTQGAQQNQSQQQSGGGLFDLIKGFIK